MYCWCISSCQKIELRLILFMGLPKWFSKNIKWIKRLIKFHSNKFFSLTLNVSNLWTFFVPGVTLGIQHRKKMKFLILLTVMRKHILAWVIKNNNNNNKKSPSTHNQNKTTYILRKTFSAKHFHRIEST